MVGIYDKVDFRGRPVHESRQAYDLVEADYTGTPGFLTIQPKNNFRLDVWAQKVANFLARRGESLGVKDASIQQSTSLAYQFKSGIVRVNIGDGRVEIEPHHPYLNEVCLELLTLAFSKNGGLVPTVR